MIDYKEVMQVRNDNWLEEWLQGGKVDELVSLLRDCRNAMCLMCREYVSKSHKGACENCRWRDEV